MYTLYIIHYDVIWHINIVEKYIHIYICCVIMNTVLRSLSFSISGHLINFCLIPPTAQEM